MTYAEVVEAVIRRMKELKVTKVWLSKELGVSRKTVQNWMACKTPIPGDSMIFIFKRLWLDLEIVWRRK